MLREDPMQSLRGLLIRSGRLFYGVKKAEISVLSVLLYVRLPFLARCMPRHALGSRLVVSRARHIGHVFTLRSFTQILYAVVVAAAVDMIKALTRPTAMRHGPHDAVCAQNTPVDTYDPITQRQRPCAPPCFHPLRGAVPIQSACRGVIPKQGMQSGDRDFSVHMYGIPNFLSCRKEVGNGFA